MVSVYRFLKTREKMMKIVFLLSSIFSVFALLSICLFLFVRGVPTIANIGFFNFIFGTRWAPSSPSLPEFGILPMILGTVYVTALSTIIGGSLGFFTAIFLYKFCPKKYVGVVRQLVNLLAGIPSVIFGLIGVVLIVPNLMLISPTFVGHGILAASIILSIMIIPTIVSISLDALNAAQEQYFEGALALGANKEQAVFRVMVPSAKNGIITSIVLGIGRAMGETTAVMMVIGGSPQMPNSLFQSVRTLTVNIAMGALDATEDVLSALIATAVVLFVFTLLLNVSVSMFRNNKKDSKKNIKKMSIMLEKANEQSKNDTKIKDKSKLLARVEDLWISFRESISPGKKFYKGLKIATYISASLSVAALIGIIGFILFTGVPHLSLHFLFGEFTMENPSIGPALRGTLYLIVIAISIATPIGIMSAIYLTEYAKEGWLMNIIRVATETLASIPSIVFGLFGSLVFVLFFGWGFSLLGGGLTLAIMILPIIIRSTEESLKRVPLSYKEGSYALGAGKVRTIFFVVLPNAAPGIITAIILSIGRVVSDTAALLLTTGMIANNIPQNVMSPGISLALSVFFFSGSGLPEAASATAVVLIFLVLGINFLATGIHKLLTKEKKVRI